MAEDVATGEYSITDYIEDYRNMDISFSTMHLKEAVKLPEDSSGTSTGVLLGECFIDKYKGDLKDLIYTKTFTKDETFRYRNNPWVLSYDLYGTVEFWQMILDLNDMVSATEFTRTTVKVYDESLVDIIGEIMMGEEDFIDYNEDELTEALGLGTGYSDDDDDEEDEDDDYDD